MSDNETAYRKEQSLLAKLPLSKEAIMIDANAKAFYHCLLRGDDPYSVIDQMLVHYTQVKSELFEKLLKHDKLIRFQVQQTKSHSKAETIDCTPDERILIENFMGQPWYFSCDWNGLMSVVQKVFDTEFGDKFEEWRVLNGRIVSAIGRIDIIDAHKKVVEFIKWHNAEKLKHKQP